MVGFIFITVIQTLTVSELYIECVILFDFIEFHGYIHQGYFINVIFFVLDTSCYMYRYFLCQCCSYCFSVNLQQSLYICVYCTHHMHVLFLNVFLCLRHDCLQLSRMLIIMYMFMYRYYNYYRSLHYSVHWNMSLNSGHLVRLPFLISSFYLSIEEATFEAPLNARCHSLKRSKLVCYNYRVLLTPLSIVCINTKISNGSMWDNLTHLIDVYRNCFL